MRPAFHRLLRLISLTGIASLAFSRAFAGADADAWLPSIQQVARWLDPAQPDPPTLQADLELVSRSFQPTSPSNTHASVVLRVPDRFRLLSGTSSNRSRIELARDPQELWLWEPARHRLSRCRLTPGSGPVGLASAATLLGLAARGCDSTQHPTVTVEGLACTPYRVRPGAIARDYLPTGDFLLTLWIEARSRLPLALRWQEPTADLDLTVWMRRLRLDRNPSPPWSRPPATAPNRVETVSMEVLRDRIPTGMRFVAIELGAVPAPGDASSIPARPPNLVPTEVKP